MPLQSFKSYKNDLFGDEDGDVLASETIPAAKPIEVAVPRPTTPSNRVQQQIALNQQKRLARLQVIYACSNLELYAIMKACMLHSHRYIIPLLLNIEYCKQPARFDTSSNKICSSCYTP